MQPTWYSHQTGEMRASKLIGTAVKNQAGETVGDINEVVLSKEGQVAAVVIGVGGFLGIGEREVAVSFDSIRLAQDENKNTVVSLNATKDALKAAPQWEWMSDSRSGTTGTGANRPPVAK
jgi:sporulation protein YlmC with PRC-barrel domain